MSEDRRKALRTQGRYWDGEARPERKLKKAARRNKDDTSRNGRQNLPTPDEMRQSSIKYEENSQCFFKELTDARKAEELKTAGITTLSKTDNGISRIIYSPNFLSEEEADGWMEALASSTPWNERDIVIRGKKYPQPRQVAWYGPFPYAYSGVILEPAEMPELVQCVRQRVLAALRSWDLGDVELNSVLLNLYRHEKDSVSWHSDDERSMGIQPTIASVSLGAVRKFEMRRKLHMYDSKEEYREEAEYFMNLSHGSLLVMDGCMQKDWEHRVPKEFHDRNPRINLTFRTVYPLKSARIDLPLGGSEKQTEGEAHSDGCVLHEDTPPPVADRADGSGRRESSSAIEDEDALKMDVAPSTNRIREAPADEASLPPAKPLNIDATPFVPRVVAPGDQAFAQVPITDVSADVTVSQPSRSPSMKVPGNTIPPTTTQPEKPPRHKTTPAPTVRETVAPSNGEPNDGDCPSSRLQALCKGMPRMRGEELVNSASLFADELALVTEGFSARDRAELELLLAITDGKQSDKNHGLICSRMHKIVSSAIYRAEHERQWQGGPQHRVGGFPRPRESGACREPRRAPPKYK